MNWLIEFLNSELANSILWTLIHSFWQGAVIALVMSFILQQKKKATAKTRYRITFGSLFFLVICVGSTFVYYQFSDLYHGLSVNSTISSSFSLNSNLSLSPKQEQIGILEQFKGTIVLAWIVGMVLFATRLVFGFLELNTIKLTRTNISNSKLNEISKKFADIIGIEKVVEIYESNRITVPMVQGYIKPAIYFPMSYFNQLTTQEVEAIIIHELGHVLHNDFIINLLQNLIEIVLFYHPGVWWISANVRAERENRCDDLAFSLGIDPIIYAKTLVKLQEIEHYKTPALAIPLAKNKNTLLIRIQRIMKLQQNKSYIRERMYALAMILVGVICVGYFSAFAAIPIPDFDNEGDEIQTCKKSNSTFTSEEIELNSLLTKPFNILPNSKSNRIKLFSQNDTLPLHGNQNNKSMQLQMENGEIKELIVDGELIDEKDYDKYIDQHGNIIGDKFSFYQRFNGRDWFENNDSTWMMGFGDVFGNRTDSLFNKHFFNMDTLMNLLDKGMYGFGDSKENIWKFHKHIAPFERIEMENLKDELEGFQFESDDEKIKFKMKDKNGDLQEFEWDRKGLMPRELEKLMEENNMLLFDNQHSFNFDSLEDIFEKNNDWNNLERIYENTHHGTNVNDILAQALRQDHLLEKDKTNKVELSGKHLKINGEKQPTNIWKKYKELYEDKAGHPLSKNSKLEFFFDGSRTNTRSYNSRN